LGDRGIHMWSLGDVVHSSHCQQISVFFWTSYHKFYKIGLIVNRNENNDDYDYYDDDNNTDATRNCKYYLFHALCTGDKHNLDDVL
jgi:hypothetical protein